MPPKRKAAAKAAAKTEPAADEVSDSVKQLLPTKRGRRAPPEKKADVAKPAVAPKRKGRQPKADKKEEKVEDVQEEEEFIAVPLKRSRRAKTAAPVEEKEKPPPTTKGKKTKKTEEHANGQPIEETKPEPTKKGRKKKTEPENIEQSSESFYEFKANDIKGEEVSLSAYRGHVCIVVNVASKCGHTKSNYEQFVQLYDEYADSKGLKILAFPCNQFGSQEPGDADEICQFVESRKVKFDMFEKIQVNGKDAHPLWKWLKEQKAGPKGSNITWNFTKFIIDKDGKVVNRFQPGVKPLKLVETLEKMW